MQDDGKASRFRWAVGRFHPDMTFWVMDNMTASCSYEVLKEAFITRTASSEYQSTLQLPQGFEIRNTKLSWLLGECGVLNACRLAATHC